MKNNKKERKGNMFTLFLGDTLFARLKEMSAHYDISASALVRELLNAKYSDFFKEINGYMAGIEKEKAKSQKQSKKDEREERIAFVKTAPCDAVTAWLREVGYWDDADTPAARHAIYENESGIRVSRMEYFEGDKFSYANDLEPVDSVIRNLIKEKKI